MKHIVCHAGSASHQSHQDGPRLACDIGLALMNDEHSSLDSVVQTVTCLEDDERFNAGTGSNLRFDGKTIQMDAACMTSNGSFGATAAIEKVKNPILIARDIMNTPHVLLVGEGATGFARQRGYEEYDPCTNTAKQKFKKIQSTLELSGEWSIDALSKSWNYETPIHSVLGSDTVGALAWDGETFAAGLSSGGLTSVLKGRVGDVPLPGCGLYAGPAGAVALTGDGEHIARSLLAYRSYLHLEKETLSLDDLVEWTLKQLPDEVDLGVIMMNREGFAGGSRHNMAWFGSSNDRETTN